MTKRHLPAMWLTLFAILAGGPLRADDTFETLKLGRVVYTNATVWSTNATFVMIKHAGGLTSVRVKDLEVEDLKNLGYVSSEPAKLSALATKMEAWTEKLRPTRTNEIVKSLSGLYEEKLKASGFEPATALIALLAGGLLLHIFYSFCMRTICLKADTKPGGMVWIPILQFIPLHRAADISPGLVLLYFVPLVGAFVFIYWCVKICGALGKSAWLVVLIFIPILNLFFIPYLAFSGSGDEAEDGRIRF